MFYYVHNPTTYKIAKSIEKPIILPKQYENFIIRIESEKERKQRKLDTR